MGMWISVVAVVAALYLGWVLYRRYGVSRIGAFNDKRRATSRMVGRGEFVDGNRHLDVALALTQSQFLPPRRLAQGVTA